MARITGYLRRQEQRGKKASPAPPGLTPQQAVGLVLLRPDDRSAEEHLTVKQLRALEPDVQQPQEHLDQWMHEVAASGLPEFEAFVTKLRQDLADVLAGLSLPWSQGQTEGQITKLKFLKQSMYGRASFDLLKQRVLYTSAAA